MVYGSGTIFHREIFDYWFNLLTSYRSIQIFILFAAKSWNLGRFSLYSKFFGNCVYSSVSRSPLARFSIECSIVNLCTAANELRVHAVQVLYHHKYILSLPVVKLNRWQSDLHQGAHPHSPNDCQSEMEAQCLSKDAHRTAASCMTDCSPSFWHSEDRLGRFRL